MTQIAQSASDWRILPKPYLKMILSFKNRAVFLYFVANYIIILIAMYSPTSNKFYYLDQHNDIKAASIICKITIFIPALSSLYMQLLLT